MRNPNMHVHNIDFHEIDVHHKYPDERLSMKQIIDEADAVHFVRDMIHTSYREEIVAVMLDRDLNPICYTTVAYGHVLTNSYIAADILRAAIISGAFFIELIRNSLSLKQPEPTQVDDDLVERLYRLFRDLNLHLRDYLIINQDLSRTYSYYGRSRSSFKEIRKGEDRIRAKIAQRREARNNDLSEQGKKMGPPTEVPEGQAAGVHVDISISPYRDDQNGE